MLQRSRMFIASEFLIYPLRQERHVKSESIALRWSAKRLGI